MKSETMKRALYILLVLLYSSESFSQVSEHSIAIIPEPVSLKLNPAEFLLPGKIIIEAGNEREIKPVAAYLKEKLQVPTGLPVDILPASSKPAIRLSLNKQKDNIIGEEGYTLSITTNGVVIKANTAAGLFYGVQTLLQIFPKEIESATAVQHVKWELPAVEIIDYPRFQWRGLMFDVARHFFTKKEVMQYIDDMVRYKYNMLHLHLSDDEGWRLEIKDLPKLTEVGAWRVDKTGYFGTFSNPSPNEPKNYGGFYTHQDVKDIVQYAKERFVNVLPEIDVPGHSLAAIASYPDLSCTVGAEKYTVRAGEPIMDWSKGAPPIGLVDNTLCPANEKVYSFLDKVLTQVAELFPFGYIHVGGDEVPQNFWKENEQIQALMKKEGLKDMHAVQGYFMRRVEKIVNAKGKKMMGWDEILEAGVAKSAGIMSWRGTKFGIEAANKGHEVVMSPSTYAYIDYMQGDSVVEPRVYASLRLSKSYEFDPAPDGADAKNIKGGQANLWTEQVTNMRYAQYMTWPRGFAIAESLWSPKSKKNWNNFFSKTEQHFKRYDVAEKKYAPSVYDPIWNVTWGDDGKLKVKLSTEADGLDIYYSFDNSFPDHLYPKYTSPLTPPKDAVMLRVITYKGKQPVGRMITMRIDELNKRAGKKK